MKIATLIVALFAVGIGWLILSPVKSNVATWRYKVLARSVNLLTKLGELTEFLGLHPCHLTVRNIIAAVPWPCPTEENIKITRGKIGGVPMILFQHTTTTNEKRPAIVYFHGGGWTINSPDVYCDLLADMAKNLKVVVVAFDYRKAPEAPFPAAFDDCLQGLLAFFSLAGSFGVDVARVAVAGDSAGGNLALAVTAHLHSGAVKGSKFRVGRLGLLYPALQALDFNLPSIHENAAEDMIGRDFLTRYWQYYITGNLGPKWVSKMLNNSHASEVTRQRSKQLLWDYLSEKSASAPDGAVDEAAVAALAPGTSDPRVSPILFPDEVLRQLPPVYLLSCEFDVLRDEAIALAKRLTKLGHPLEHDHSMYYHGAVSLAKLGDPEAVRVFKNFKDYLIKNLWRV